MSGAGRTRRLLYVLNPTKFRAVSTSFTSHERREIKLSSLAMMCLRCWRMLEL